MGRSPSRTLTPSRPREVSKKCCFSTISLTPAWRFRGRVDYVNPSTVRTWMTTSSRPESDAAQPLRGRLLDAAVPIVDTEGLEALTLRSLATAANVSRQAPYLYFESKATLLAALALEGFRREESF